MIQFDQAIAIDGIRQFLERHATCGRAFLDTPPLPDGAGYRALAACCCGDTAEYWLSEGLLPPHHLLAAISAAAAPSSPSEHGTSGPRRKVA